MVVLLGRHPRCLPLSPPPALSPPRPDHPNLASSFSPPAPLPRRRLRWPCARRPARYSNAEGVRPGRFGFRDVGGGEGAGGGDGGQEEAEEGEGRGYRRRGRRKWWSDEPYDDEDPDPLDDDDDDGWEQPWERVWIFKVFKSYGYVLPAIIASMLLATGPKAFLMALALPLGQSALSLAIDKLWGNASRVTQPKSKSKRKPFARSAGNFRREEEEIGRGYQGKEAYKSWVAADAVTSDTERQSRAGAFGGWDELDRRREYAEEPQQQQHLKTASASTLRAPAIKKGKLSRRERNRDIPLLLRLLIAIFPFLGSWTRIL